MEISPIYVIVSVVSFAVLGMVGINLYYLLKSRRTSDGKSNQYVVMHQRLDAISTAMNDHFEKHNKFIKLISERFDKDKK